MIIAQALSLICFFCLILIGDICLDQDSWDLGLTVYLRIDKSCPSFHSEHPDSDNMNKAYKSTSTGFESST